jgi:hypothetical protein
MNIELTREFLLWCTIINMHRFHGKWFRLSDERFDAAHYTGMAVFKIGIILFNLVPLVVLYIIG